MLGRYKDSDQLALDDRCRAAGLKPEWGDVLRDLDRLQEATIESGGKSWRVRTEATGWVPVLLRLAGVALLPRVQATSPPAAAPPPPPKRRGRPRRSATRA